MIGRSTVARGKAPIELRPQVPAQHFLGSPGNRPIRGSQGRGWGRYRACAEENRTARKRPGGINGYTTPVPPNSPLCIFNRQTKRVPSASGAECGLGGSSSRRMLRARAAGALARAKAAIWRPILNALMVRNARLRPLSRAVQRVGSHSVKDARALSELPSLSRRHHGSPSLPGHSDGARLHSATTPPTRVTEDHRQYR
jgi:hypothetical protein